MNRRRWAIIAFLCLLPCGTASAENRLLVGEEAKSSGEREIPLMPVMELDFKSKDQLFRLREGFVAQQSLLTDVDAYEPAADVFGAVEGDLPWWGLNGIYFFGPGATSLDGPSEESRFLCNPYLLVGVSEYHAYVTQLKPPPESVRFYPEPVALVWRADERRAAARYNVSDHFRFLERNRYPLAEQKRLSLIAYNARDFGLNYLYVDPDGSSNIAALHPAGQPVIIRQFLHRGMSCGIPEGCNNMSPETPELDLEIRGLPARVLIKLWRDKPADASAAPDFTFLLELE